MRDSVKDHFKSSGNIIRMLGEQLVSNKFIAVLELIRNAFDADARKVEVKFAELRHPLRNRKVTALTISDNGNGMTLQDISTKWLVLGTPNKEDDKLSPAGRRLLGSKGIGRFALQKLGHFSRVTTIPDSSVLTVDGTAKGRSKRHSFDVNWNKVVDPRSILDSYDIKIKVADCPAKRHGYKVTIFDLCEPWSREDVEKLQREIANLLPPDFELNFSVGFSHWKFKPKTIKLRSSLFESATYSIKGEVDGKGKGVVFENGKSKEIKISTSSCGPFSFELYAYDTERVKTDFRGRATQLLTALSLYHGIKIYRDQFRVKPYGDPQTDWLGLDPYRIKSFNRFDSKSTIGIVRITSEGNPKLVDQTNREGILSGPALTQLKAALFSLVNRLSTKNVAWHKAHSSKGAYRKARREAKRAVKGTKAKQSVKSFAHTADKLIRDLEETNADLRAFAAIGLSFLGIGHDLLEEVKLARALVRELAENSKDAEYVSETAHSLRDHMNIVWSFIQLLEQYGHAEHRTPEKLRADDVVRLFFRRYGPLLQRTGTGVRLRLKLAAGKSNIRMARRDLESILINLTTNAIQAMQATRTNRVIAVSTQRSKGAWVLRFSDTGPGIDPSIREYLFETGFTTKEEEGGSGLGLAIVHSAVSSCEGTVAVDDDGELGGATFRIEVPCTR